jgi:hypothetical protein
MPPGHHPRNELDLIPISALASIYVIGAAREVPRTCALVIPTAPQSTVDHPLEVTGADRRARPVETVTWTTDRARKAGYTSNRKYDTDPQSMLYARAAGDVARRIAPDVLAGVPYSAEEIELADIATVTVTRENKPRTVTRQPPPAVEEPPRSRRS